MVDEYHAGGDTITTGEQRVQSARQLAGRLDTGQPGTDDHDGCRRRCQRPAGQSLQMLL
ncbi:Uncharacterised protein [Mycobacterium tuberculosis]|nr:Uncharacterised protein [Mycobacterium tuberculosis]